tara:strand:- start:372 stop:863 length:492 start_codon:yes stop_codon:yes gene_type:complete
VSQHNKIITLTENTGLNIIISEMVNYGPRTILFKGHVIQFNCFIAYDRRCHTRLLIKCAIIGPNISNNVQLEVWHWNALTDSNFAYVKTDLESVEEFNAPEIQEVVTFYGMKNYISESDGVVLQEKVTVNEAGKRPTSYSCKIHDFDVNEECQEVYVIGVRFT